MFKEVNKEDKFFSEIAIRLIGYGDDGVPYSFGTAFVLRPSLLVTARHVLEEFIKRSKKTEDSNELELTFWAIQIEWIGEQFNYNIWQVVKSYSSLHSDLALLHIVPYNDTAGKYKHWKILPVTLEPPEIGEQVIGFGFHNMSFEGSVILESGKLEHLNMNSNSSSSRGNVSAVFMEKRDAVMLPFPCFEVDARFDPGMSGGLVINSTSEICGIICSSIPVENVHISYVALLWPIMAVNIDFGNSGIIKGIHPLFKLCQIGRWQPKGWNRIVLDSPYTVRYLKNI